MASMADPLSSQPLLLLKISEVFVYKLPKLQGSMISQGRRAEHWLSFPRDLANPVITGSLKVVSLDEIIYIQIFKPGGELFAAAPIRVEEDKPLEFFLEGCRDSSRYFVLRIEDPKSQRHAYLGIGFRERQSAFDLRAALDDQLRRVKRQKATVPLPKAEETEKPEIPVKPLLDLSLKEGETIKVNLNLPKSETRKAGSSSSVQIEKIAPLPTQPKPVKSTKEDNQDEDDWGEFQS